MANVLATFAVLSAVGAFIGYSTKWAAFQLMFRPARFVGIGPLGWQGVVQRRAPKFSLGIAETLDDVAPLDELVDSIDALELARALVASIGDQLDLLAPSVLDAVAPGAWEAAPNDVRAMLRGLLVQEAEAIVAETIEEAKPALVSAIDVEALVVEMLSGENAQRLADLLQRLIDQEMKTVIRFGAYVGFCVGLAEAAAYLVFDRWWLLPAIGAADGLLNGWMGIQMVFRPLERRRYLGLIHYQGLFPSRQAAIAHEYGTMIGAEVLTPAALVSHLQSDAALEPLIKTARSVAERRLAPQLELLAPALGLEPDPDLFQRVFDACVATIAAQGLVAGDLPDVFAVLDEQLQVAATVESRLASLDPIEFEQIIRGIFDDDEVVLIGVGGVLGAGIGCVQAAVAVAFGLGHAG